MHPSRAIAVEIADQVAIFTESGAVRSRHVVRPLLPLLATEVEVESVLLPLVRFDEWEQVAERHLERPILVDRESAGVPPLSNSHLLDPTDRVESPSLEIRDDRLLDPPCRAPSVPVAPDADVLRVAQARRVDVIQADREKPFPFGRNQPPAILVAVKREKSVRFDLRRRNCVNS